MLSPCSATAPPSRRLGAEHAHYVYEPVGAAFFYARQLDHDATVLVADFGGGTSDFSVMRFSQSRRRAAGRALGPCRHRHCRRRFRLPDRRQGRLAPPRQGRALSLHGQDPVDPEPLLRQFRALEPARHDEGQRRSEGIARARPRRARSRAAGEVHRHHRIRSGLCPLSRRLLGQDGAVEPRTRPISVSRARASTFSAKIARADFEGWIAEDVARIAGHGRCRRCPRPASRPGEIERVFLTGGTSFVPAIRRLFVDRFGENRLTSADQFESIAYGLALIGQTEDAGRWAVANEAESEIRLRLPRW